jgi:beta-glucanase (GH16 family)
MSNFPDIANWNVEDRVVASNGTSPNGDAFGFSKDMVSQLPGGGLRLSMTYQPGIYYGAQILTKPLKSFLYGFFEINAKIPKGQIWSSFYMVGDVWPPEIDVYENWDGLPNLLQMSVHHAPDDLTRTLRYLAGMDLSLDYHKYAVDWRADQVIWYLDGVDIFRTRDYVPSTPLYLYIYLACGGNHGWPDPATLPVYYDIDYVRVWQKP